MQQETDTTAIDVLNIGHWLANLEGVLTFAQQWGEIRTLLENLCSCKNKRTVGFLGDDAQSMLNNLKQRYYDDEKYVEQTDITGLRSMVSRWRGRLDVVSQRWVLSMPRAHLDASRLQDGIKAFLNDEECSALNSLEQQGLDEAASCLLFNNFTSAEFIALRSVESLLRRWYEKKTGNKLEQEKWGEILEELNNLYPKKSERPKELSLLGYLRGRRNEIAHPEVISNPEEATSTFLNVIAVCKTVKIE